MQKPTSHLWLTTDAKFKFLDVLCRDQQLLPADKLVAFALLRHLDSRSGTATVRQATIIGDTGLCERTVRKAIPRLEHQGWFEVQREFLRAHVYQPVWYRMIEPGPAVAA